MKPSDRVNWSFVPSGGYGFAQSVAARVLSISPKRVTIAVMTTDGKILRRHVKPESLSPREKHVPGLDDKDIPTNPSNESLEDFWEKL